MATEPGLLGLSDFKLETNIKTNPGDRAAVIAVSLYFYFSSSREFYHTTALNYHFIGGYQPPLVVVASVFYIYSRVKTAHDHL